MLVWRFRVVVADAHSCGCRFRGLALGIVFASSAIFTLTASADEIVKFSDAERNHWAFQPVVRPAISVASGFVESLSQSAVDGFIFDGLQKYQSRPSPVADRFTLLRRVTFDLIGLPPTPAAIQDFLADDSPDAYERLIDRLLANPHYGEAWGRMWLDVVRFAETAGFNADPARPLAYKYRDYVIRAFNRDLPFDRFLQDQLAGDELFPDDVEAIAATGYCRMWADESNASNIYQARQLALNDLTSNLGAAVLGLSIGCAQCHDHKFDPLLQKDFYQLQAFFSGIVLEDQMPIGSHQQLSDYRRQMQQWLEQTSELRHELQAVEREARLKQSAQRRMRFPAEILAAIDCLPDERTILQRQWTFWAERQMEYKPDELPNLMTDEQRVRREELLKLLTEAKRTQPKPLQEASLMAVAEISQIPPSTHLMANGSFDNPLEELPPDFPAILRTNQKTAPPTFVPPNEHSSGRRSVLARWLTAPDNPLTHRVWVNRIWQGHFGRGLVENANDFGVLTTRPEHSQLLDWLTSDFIVSEFSTKRLHRLVTESATYKQRGQIASNIASDPMNYSCFPRNRLSSERVRDAWLAASGTLNDTMFGPGVRPELPPNFGGSANWKVSDSPERTRRSVYIYAKRNLPYPLLAAFDFPDMHETCGCRTTTTIAPQALTLLNSDLIVSAARQFAGRVNQEANTIDPITRIAVAWQIAFGREPQPRETSAAIEFLAKQQKMTAKNASNLTDGNANPENLGEAFVDLCHALLNTNEFLFIE